MPIWDLFDLIYDVVDALLERNTMNIKDHVASPFSNFLPGVYVEE